MNKLMMFILLFVLPVVLAACGSSPAGEANSQSSDGAATSPSSNQPMLTQEQLAIGSLKLEQTDLAITLSQASNLLPLWQAYQSLLQSDTTAQAELTGLLGQIEGEMSADQLAAIASMDLNPDDMTAIMDELGLRPVLEDGSNGVNFGAGGRPEGFPNGFTPGLDQGPGGGLGGGRFPGGAESLTPDQIATFQAQNPDFANRAARGGNTFLIRPLITLLESKLG